MARYRKIDIRMWGDSRFRELSSPGPSAKYLWVFLLTGPQTSNIPGLFRSGEMGLAEEIGWSIEGFRKGFAELLAKGLVKVDWKARVVWVPNAIKYNAPDNPNVVKSWRTAWDEIPECALKAEAYERLRTVTKGLGEGFAKAFTEGCAKGLANQEQEQEQEKDTTPEPSSGSTSPSRKKKPVKTPLPENFGISDAIRKWALTKNYGSLEEHLEHFIGDVKAHGRTYIDWDQALQNAIRDDYAKLRTSRNGRGKNGAVPKPLAYTPLTHDETVRRAGLEARTAGVRN